MNLTIQEMAKIVAKVRREVRARASAAGRRPDSGFSDREKAYLKAHPHLAEHAHCGLCPDSPDAPRKKVKLPNGIVIYSSWYKVPKTDEDAKRALKETLWLNENGGGVWTSR